MRSTLTTVAMLIATGALLTGCTLPFTSGPATGNGGDTVNQIDDAYQRLDELQQGLGQAIGVTWGAPTAIGPAPCSTANDQLEVWLDRPASSSRPIQETLSIARDYLAGEGLTVDALGFEEFQDGELFADRVTARQGAFLIELRASTNGVVTVTGVSECIPGDWTGTGWEPPSA